MKRHSNYLSPYNLREFHDLQADLARREPRPDSSPSRACPCLLCQRPAEPERTTPKPQPERNPGPVYKLVEPE